MLAERETKLQANDLNYELADTTTNSYDIKRTGWGLQEGSLEPLFNSPVNVRLLKREEDRIYTQSCRQLRREKELHNV